MNRKEWKCKGFLGYKNQGLITNFNNGQLTVPVGSPCYLLLESSSLLNRAFKRVETNEKRLTKLINK